MKRKELHKAADGLLKNAQDFYRSRFIDDYDKETVELLVALTGIPEMLAEFHLHQNKKMLEGWTDDRIDALYPIEYKTGGMTTGAIPHNFHKREAAKRLRDELLKQLEG